MARKRLKRKSRNRKESLSIGVSPFSVLIIVAVFLALYSLVQVFGAKPGGGGSYDLSGGCAGKTTRPCYDKLTTSGVNILGKNGENAYTSCVNNAAPNKVGEIIHKTSVCGQEKVSYCHDGKSNNFIRKFGGDCVTEPPPPPPPSPEPTSTPAPTPVSDIPFRITYPDNGVQLPYGSQQIVRWEGGDTVNEWPVYLSIQDRNRSLTLREMVIGTPNDGQENWIVDLPLGDYYGYYGQGCRNATCASPSQWDYTEKFSVVAGDPVEKVSSSYPLNQSLVVLSPSGGETWDAGSAQKIKWSGGTNDWKINISLIDYNAHTTYTTLFSNLSNSGFQDWTVPGFVPSGQYTMYVSCSNCGAAPAGFTGGFYTYSFYPFTIK